MQKTIFNSVGSNYTLGFAVRALLDFSGNSAFLELQNRLSVEYGGQALLFYKGRQALEYALLHAGFASGSAIVLSAYTCVVLPTAVKNQGHVPLYADISKESLNFSTEELERIYTPKVKAVVVQNTLGFVADIVSIEAFCRKHGIVLIEDLAHSVGAQYLDGRSVGSVGDYVILSFSQDKLLDVVSGGALIIRTKDVANFSTIWTEPSFFEQLRDKLYPILSWKIRTLYSFFGIGKLLHTLLRRLQLLPRPVISLDKKPFQKLPGWYASLVLKRLTSFPLEIERRRNLARRYLSLVPELLHPCVSLESIASGSCLRIPITVSKPNELVSSLALSGVHLSDIWYDVPISPKRFWYLYQPEHKGDLATQTTRTMFNLPTHMTLTEKDVERIVRSLRVLGVGKDGLLG